MMARERIPDFEAKLQSVVERWAADAAVAAAYLFGSYARGDARPTSDVDLAMSLDAQLSPAERWRQRLALMEAASAELGSDAAVERWLERL